MLRRKSIETQRKLSLHMVFSLRSNLEFQTVLFTDPLDTSSREAFTRHPPWYAKEKIKVEYDMNLVERTESIAVAKGICRDDETTPGGRVG
ncbi:hypothetical protein AAC03nite_26630 [Alicyclobacillus acidoterrestris]|nr:hypothetical protein AAC03nite_26630 [Alicyclobacillus acidoterrestris]